MSRTDKDRPIDIRQDDPTEKGWFVEHRHGILPCDYHPANNTFDFKLRHNERPEFLCRGMLSRPRHDSYPSSKRCRQLEERRFRHACSQELRTWNEDSPRTTKLALRHPKDFIEVRSV
ncbi:MAG TPA: hypothetical protein VFT87_03845 [Candidatus Saccharimonadales bacterium]|nr:hypothetical protein [Candidatus Saccharimonadales bacterium]